MTHEKEKANDRIGDSVKVSSRICPIHGAYLWESVDKVKEWDRSTKPWKKRLFVNRYS